MKFGRSFKSQNFKCFMCLRNALTLQHVIFIIIILMRIKQLFYFIEIHYMAHKTNLVVQN
jgi:hypothetical protein